MHETLTVVILAAGQGTRMNSALPKVVHPIGNRPMLAHVIDVAKQLSPHEIHVVYGHGGDQVITHIDDSTINWCLQPEQLGTGHAVLQALPKIRDDDTVLILYGDVPLIRRQTLQNLLRVLDGCALSLLTVHKDSPDGYGRIIRDDHGGVRRIVEDKDANDNVRAISEINTGILSARAHDLKRWLAGINNNNVQAEYYLTDCVEMAVEEGQAVEAVVCGDFQEVLGINDKVQLAECERVYQHREVHRLMRSGVTVRDPARIDIRGKVIVGQDVKIDINVLLEGEVHIGDNVAIGPNCVIKDSKLGAGTQIKPNSIIEQAEVGERCLIGPFSRIHPEAQLADEVQIGNFVEVKKSMIERGSKVNQLSCIGDDVFIGSDTRLIAPVIVNNGVTIDAGSTITKDVPEHKLTLTRVRQQTIEGWERPKKQPKPC